jgi:ribosomal protein S14
MNVETIELEEDKVTKALNKRMDEEARQEALDKEVDKRLAKKKTDDEEREKKDEVHEATFEDETDGKKKKVKTKEKVECASCGSDDVVKTSNDEDLFNYRGRDVKAVYHCNNCGRRSGVVEE